MHDKYYINVFALSYRVLVFTFITPDIYMFEVLHIQKNCVQRLESSAEFEPCEAAPRPFTCYQQWCPCTSHHSLLLLYFLTGPFQTSLVLLHCGRLKTVHYVKPTENTVDQRASIPLLVLHFHDIHY
jgi:hypothetical protein